MRHRARQRGTVLIVAMLVSFALASLVLALCRSMRAENMAAANEAAALQADAIERGAEQYVVGMLDQEGEDVVSLSENAFNAVRVGDGYFWILRPQYEDSSLPVFGLTGESSKVNLNSTDFDALSNIPGMEYTAASSIMDWRDEDNRLERDGAESDYYLQLPEAYYCKNAPFETVEELLMVRGVTREMLYGDGTAPPLGESTGMVVHSLSSLTLDQTLSRGMFDLFTVKSSEPNTAADGQRRINVNVDRSQRPRMRQQLLERLKLRMDQARATAIVSKVGDNRMQDMFVMYYRCGLTADELDKIADDIGTSTAATLTGRININTAPREVLLSIPTLDESDVDKLISARPSMQNIKPGELSWVVRAMGERTISAGLGARITTHTYQWTADILAVSGNGRAFKRCRITVDTQSGTPQIVYRRDLTQKGWPMDTRILAAIRNGEMQASGGNSSRVGGMRG
jgi:type II secretory pathway component PulK